METISTPTQRKSIRAQVAGSKGSTWMISSYNAWQQSSPLGSRPTRCPLTFLRLVSRITPKVKLFGGVKVIAFALILVTNLFFIKNGFGQTTVGPNNPSTGLNIAIGTNTDWSNPGNITAVGTPYATSSFTQGTNTDYLRGTGYGFSIPAGATINGIQVVINRNGTQSFSVGVMDNAVYLVKDVSGSPVIQTSGNNKATTSTWPTSFGISTYGSASDLWNLSWSPQEINSPNFGVALSAHNNSSLSNRTATVDYIQIKVTYTPCTPTAAPVITGIYCPGGISVSGTSSEAAGTSIIVYKAGTTQIGTTTVSGGVWSATVPALAASDVITATATAGGKCVSAASAGMTVQSISATPVITGTYCQGGISVSGTSSEANGTSVTVYKAGTTQIASATVSGGTWTAIVGALAASDVITAKATAGGKCVSAASPGVTVGANMTVSTASSTPSVCKNSSLSPNITHTTTVATGIGTPVNLPPGVNAAYGSNTITISGSPTVTGTFIYSIPLTGGCGTVNATGTITVTDVPAQPSSIGGNSMPSAETSYVYSITNVPATTYAWTFPSGWLITAGTGTNSVTVTAGTTSGTVTVTPSNGCGNGIAQTLTVTVNAFPVASVTGQSNLTCFASGDGTITVKASGGSGTGYTFSKDNGDTWVGSGNEYTFTGLNAGVPYKIRVKDSLGSPSPEIQ